MGLGWRTRAISAAVAVACGGVLGLAAHLEPDPAGHGTHRALGLPPCGMILTSGIPCPTCGMTTSFALVMHGRPIAAFLAQPAGMVLCLATVACMLTSVWIMVGGRVPAVRWERINPTRWMIGFGFLLMGGWGFKIAQGLLTGGLPRH